MAKSNASANIIILCLFYFAERKDSEIETPNLPLEVTIHGYDEDSLKEAYTKIMDLYNENVSKVKISVPFLNTMTTEQVHVK